MNKKTDINPNTKTNEMLKNINIIDTLYTEATYNSRYGLDILITIIIVFTLLLIFGYFSVMNNLKSLKANWDNEKCNPINFPFVPLINRDPNKTPQEQINDNMNECIENGVNDISTGVTNNIYKSLGIFSFLQDLFQKFVTFIQKIFIWLKNTIIYLINTILTTIQKTHLGVIQIFLAAKTILDRLLAILVVKFFIFIQFLNIGMAFMLNFGTIATITIMVPLGITIALLAVLILIFSLLGMVFAKIGGIFAASWILAAAAPPWFAASIVKFTIMGTLISTLVSTIVLFIIMGTVMAGFMYIESHANKFIAPSLEASR